MLEILGQIREFNSVTGSWLGDEVLGNPVTEPAARDGANFTNLVQNFKRLIYCVIYLSQ